MRISQWSLVRPLRGMVKCDYLFGRNVEIIQYKLHLSD